VLIHVAATSFNPSGIGLRRGWPVTAVHFVARNDTSHLAALVKLVDASAVRVDIAASRPLTDLASVHRDAETGRTRGKTILVP
jgi:NADPH:quinone reductase-like Zn-dependent oxidoreductase